MERAEFPSHLEVIQAIFNLYVKRAAAHQCKRGERGMGSERQKVSSTEGKLGTFRCLVGTKIATNNNFRFFLFFSKRDLLGRSLASTTCVLYISVNIPKHTRAPLWERCFIVQLCPALPLCLFQEIYIYQIDEHGPKLNHNWLVKIV